MPVSLQTGGGAGEGETVTSSGITDVSFSIRSGETVALVGPSGSGKSTVAKLVAGLYDVNEGSIGLGGVDLCHLAADSIKQHVGMVTQDAFFFHDTVAANLRYARPDATDAQLREVLDAVLLGELLSGMPNGLATVLGNEGARLSGGERQRLALARLLLRMPSVVVLDEATAHLDPESEAQILKTLVEAFTDCAMLLITHHLSTVRLAETILVMQDGRVAEYGNHDRLMSCDGVYATMARAATKPK